MLRSLACVALFLTGAAVATADDSGLLYRWKFGRQFLQGDKLQASVGKLPGRILGAAKFSSEPPSSLMLDGKGKNRIVVSDISTAKLPKKQLTVVAWVKVDRAMPWGGICGAIQDNGSYERGWLLGYRNNRFFMGLSSIKKKRLTYLTSRAGFELGMWYQVAGTYDGKVLSVFVDGRLRNQSRAQAGEIFYPPKGEFTIGAYRDDNETHPMKGQIEQVSVFTRALSSKEIAADFAARKSKFPRIDPLPPQVADWPTYMRDNHRSGMTREKLKFPLYLQWSYQARHAPAPAWPLPAKQNFWANKFNLRARVVYDRAFHVVTVGDSLYFGSSSNDQLVCLDTRSGQTKWKFFAEGPVRLAPTIADGKVLFGSDDGHVYCLSADDGSLRWKFRLGPSDRRVPGNERVISPWPVRTDVLVDGKIAYFAAGIFPSQGVYQAAVDIDTGKKVASGQLQVSAQGYLQRKAGRLHIQTGRDPAGTLTSRLSRRGGKVKELVLGARRSSLAFVGADDVRIGGGDGKVTAWNAQGKQIWSTAVKGKAYSLAISRGKLFVSTDRGVIYCFSDKARTKPLKTQPRKLAFAYRSAVERQRADEMAAEILQRSKITRGYCLLLNSGRGELAYELARRTKLQIIAVESDPKKAKASRRKLDAAGLYGQVTVHHLSSTKKLPYTSYMFNLVVDGSRGSRPFNAAEVARVTRPHGGINVQYKQRKIQTTRRGELPGAGDWSHMYANPANTVCSADELVSGRLQLQWFGRPGPRQMIDRHNRTIAPVTKNGRLFIPANNRIIAVDAYNGTPLWNVPVANFRRVGAYRDASNLVAADDFLYVAAAGQCFGLDSETGRKKLTFKVPQSDPGKPGHWGFLAIDGNRLFGSVTQPGASRTQHGKATINEVYHDFGTVVGSQSLFSMDRVSAGNKWQYKSAGGMILNPTITVGHDKMYFVESKNRKVLTTKNGRATMKQLLASGSELVAIDKRSGDVIWRKVFDFTKIQHSLYVSYSNGMLAIVGSRNTSKDRRRSKLKYDIHVVDARTGSLKWKRSQQQATSIGGSHGEQDHHQVIVGNRLYCEPFAYNLQTGKPVANWRWKNRHRRGCGNIAASAKSFFFRDHTLTTFDLASNRYDKVSKSTRPGCWINMIPAGGLLLVPEASSGCTCNFAVQTSLAFIPIK